MLDFEPNEADPGEAEDAEARRRRDQEIGDDGSDADGAYETTYFGDNSTSNAIMADSGVAAIEGAKAVGGLAARGFGRLAGLARDAMDTATSLPGLDAAGDLLRGAAGAAGDVVQNIPGAAQAVGEGIGSAASAIDVAGVVQTVGHGVASAASAVDLGAVADAAGSVAGAALEGAAGIVGDILNA